MKRSAKLPAPGMYRLDLPERAVQAIVNALAAAPYATAAPVLTLLQRQCQAQDTQRAAEAAAVQRREIEAELEPAIRARILKERSAKRISPI